MVGPPGRQRGAPLPYTLLAGVVPCPGGWLVAAGRLQGISLHPIAPQVLEHFVDVLDYKPSFQVIALAAPVGLLEEPSHGGRNCDREARRMLGRRRGSAILSPPSREALRAPTFEEAQKLNEGLSAVTWTLVRRWAEVDAEMQPYWQRTVFEVHPELAFYQLNGDRPLRFSKHSHLGRKERRALLEPRVQGISRITETPVKGARASHVIDAAACLWTARRIASRSVNRVPEDPEWDDLGLRMEIIR